jgi:hypothetical protein
MMNVELKVVMTILTYHLPLQKLMKTSRKIQGPERESIQDTDGQKPEEWSLSRHPLVGNGLVNILPQ